MYQYTLFESTHDLSTKKTAPAPFCDHVTIPVGRYPLTLAVQVMVADEPTEMLVGLQETEVVEVTGATVRESLPSDGAFFESPP
jgi:hypothetical protein